MSVSSFQFDQCRILFAQRQLITAHPNFDRIAERRYFSDGNVGAGDDAHIQQPQSKGACAVYLFDQSFAAYREPVKRHMRCHPFSLKTFLKIGEGKGGCLRSGSPAQNNVSID